MGEIDLLKDTPDIYCPASRESIIQLDSPAAR
jgi:hypothetical protein